MPGVYRKRRKIPPTAARAAHSLCCGSLRVIGTTNNTTNAGASRVSDRVFPLACARLFFPQRRLRLQVKHLQERNYRKGEICDLKPGTYTEGARQDCRTTATKVSQTSSQLTDSIGLGAATKVSWIIPMMHNI